MNKINDNKPVLASARLDQMIEFAVSHAQEKKERATLWTWPRLTMGFGSLAMAASVVGIMWLSPATVVPTKHPASAGRAAAEISDYLLYETFEDLS